MACTVAEFLLNDFQTAWIFFLRRRTLWALRNLEPLQTLATQECTTVGRCEGVRNHGARDCAGAKCSGERLTHRLETRSKETASFRTVREVEPRKIIIVASDKNIPAC